MAAATATVGAPALVSVVHAAEAPACMIDTDILNEKSLKHMDDIALSFFASACGKNRGAFVLDPPDGQTYGCLEMPADIGELAGIPDLAYPIKDANAIKEQYVGKNTTASETLALLEFVVERVYDATPNKDSTPYGCEINGLAKLSCGPDLDIRSPRKDGEPIRSVSLAGLLVPALWATGGKDIELSDVTTWYTSSDFDEMAKLGLNTVQIDVPTSPFVDGDLHGQEVLDVLLDILKLVDDSGLQAIIKLVATGDQLDAVVGAAEYFDDLPVILGVTLPIMSLDVKEVVHSIRTVATTLPIFLPLNEGDLTKIHGGDFDDHVFGSLDVSHAGTVADVASSSSQEDRSKLFYHEAVSCMIRSPLEYSNCFRDMPIFWSTGFDLSIDDCINKNLKGHNFKDYGQCDRFDETTDSGWWLNHRASFAARQLYAAERGLGWSFATWKLLGNDDVGVIDSPEKLLSLQDVVEAGIFPELTGVKIPAQDACLNPPVNDFVLGDDTLAPTAGPPPDCGNGWWNYTGQHCDYWVPPPEPTPAPTEPCPACSDVCSSLNGGDESQSDKLSLLLAALGGAAAVLVIGGIVKAFGGNRRQEYSQIPN